MEESSMESVLGEINSFKRIKTVQESQIDLMSCVETQTTLLSKSRIRKMFK